MDESTCPEQVYRGQPFIEACGRPIKRRGYCGVHANMHDREELRLAEVGLQHNLRRAAQAQQAKAMTVAQFLGDKLGVALFATDDGHIAMTLDTASTWLNNT